MIGEESLLSKQLFPSCTDHLVIFYLEDTAHVL